MADDDTKPTAPETLRTEAPEPRRPSIRELSTFKAPAQRFALGDELGRGGMGKVVAARDVSLRRGVAIKQMLSDDESDLDRFEREVRITAELEHPSIVPIHDIGVDEHGRPYYVMRQIQGDPLSTRIAALTSLGARLPLLPNLLAAADAAAFAHARRIIHRDIKPANILLGAFGETLLIDWGLARRLDEAEPSLPDAAQSLPAGALTIAGHVYGTAAYMPPEQARGEVVDERADVYALGATLFHILVGRGPFDGMSAGERIEAAVTEQPPPLEALPAAAPTELRAIVTKAMASQAADRYPHAGALAADLRAFLEGQFVGAHRYTRRERVVRFARRHRTALAVAMFAAIAIVVTGLIAIDRVIDERSEARSADASAVIANRAASDRQQLVDLEQASMLAELDTPRAIARLRRLPADSPYLRRAHDIALKAVARGIPHGDHEHDASINALELSPDRKRIASADVTGRIVVRTLDHEITARVELGHPVERLAWLGDDALIVNAPDGITAIAAKGGAITHHGRGHKVEMIAVADPPDRLRFIDADTHELLEVAVATGATRVLARDVTMMVARGERILVAGTRGVRWVRPEGEVLLTTKVPRVEINLALSDDGRRAGVVINQEVFEWDDTGKELGHWELKLAIRPFYAGTSLYVQTMRSSIALMSTTSATELVINRSKVIGAPSTSLGLAAGFENGRLILFEQALLRELPFDLSNVRKITGAPDSTMVAMGSATGVLQWWDLAAVAPRRVTVGNFSACGTHRDRAYVLNMSSDIVEIDLRSMKPRVVGKIPRPLLADCRGVVGNGVIVYSSPEGGFVVDLAAKKGRQITSDWVAISTQLDAVLFARGRELLRLDHGVEPARIAWTAPSPIIDLVVSGRWVGARLQDGQLFRLDLETGASTALHAWPGYFNVTSTGDVWYSTDRWLWRWTETGPHLVATFQAPIGLVLSNGDPMTVGLRDESLWLVTAEGQVQSLARLGKIFDFGARHLTVFRDGNTLVMFGSKTLERITYQVTEGAQASRLSEDERVLFAAVGPDVMLMFVDDVPTEPAAFKDWLAKVTNAVLDDKTDALSWANASPGRSRAP